MSNQENNRDDIGQIHNKTGFAEQAPGLIWWTTLGKSIFKENLEKLCTSQTKILDLGSGGGRVVEQLIDLGASQENITGIELNPEQVEKAKQLYPHANFICGDISDEKNFPPDQSLDLITTSMVIEFLSPEQLENVLAHSHQALKNGGTFFLVTTHPDKMKATSGLENEGPFTVQFPWGGEGPNYYRTRDTFIASLQKAGFEIETIQDLNLPPEAEAIDQAEYQRYMQYPNTRLAIKAVKR